MKKLLTLLSIVLFTFTAFSQHSIFTVFSNDGDKFTLYVDGEKINETPKSRVADIENENEAVNFRIVFEDSNIPVLKKYASLTGVESRYNKITFGIKEKKGKYKVRGISFEPYDSEAGNSVEYVSTEEVTTYEEDETVSTESTSTNTSDATSGNNVASSETSITTSITTTTTSASSAGSISLKYQWKAGATYRFNALQDDEITMSVGGMEMHDIFHTQTTFALKVSNVLSNGTAEGFLYVENFKVTDKSGATVAGMKDIPAEALKSIVEVNAKGKFTFKTISYIIVNDGVNMLVSAEVKDGKVSGQAQVGDQKISVQAEFDPKTGTVKAGYSMETVKKPEPKTVKVKEDAQRVDVLPLAFLDMLVLPEGAIAPGGSLSVKMMEYVFTTKANAVTNNIASLDLNIKTDRSKGSSSSMGGMDMGGMDMGGMGGMPEMDINGDIAYEFDLTDGIFKVLSGTLTSTMKGMGLDFKVKSTLIMSLVK